LRAVCGLPRALVREQTEQILARQLGQLFEMTRYVSRLCAKQTEALVLHNTRVHVSVTGAT
jgi:hypothetical protein